MARVVYLYIYMIQPNRNLLMSATVSSTIDFLSRVLQMKMFRSDILVPVYICMYTYIIKLNIIPMSASKLQMTKDETL